MAACEVVQALAGSVFGKGGFYEQKRFANAAGLALNAGMPTGSKS